MSVAIAVVQLPALFPALRGRNLQICDLSLEFQYILSTIQFCDVFPV